LEPPHLQRAYGPRTSASLPSGSIKGQSPSTRKGPFFTTLIFAEVFSISPTDPALLYVRAPEGHRSMTDLISSELAPCMFIQGLLSWLNTLGRPFTHSLTCMHFSGFHWTISSPLVYSFIIIGCYFFLLRFSAAYNPYDNIIIKFKFNILMHLTKECIYLELLKLRSVCVILWGKDLWDL